MASVMGTGTALRTEGVHQSTQSEQDEAGQQGCPRRSDLDTMIEREIIPRLLVVNSTGGAARPQSCTAPLTAEEVAKFAPLPLELEAHELLAVIEGFLARGVTIDSVFVDLLAPSARRLGQLWEDDSCDFIDVTMGLWRLQEVMREIAIRGLAEHSLRQKSRSALFSPIPGDQHSFGALMIEETFALAGWQSEVLIDPRRRDLLQSVSEQPFDLVGLTLSCDCPSGTASDIINSIRSVSKNPDIKIIIGGRLPLAHPGFVDAAGADGTAPDARAALAFAEKIVPDLRVVVP